MSEQRDTRGEAVCVCGRDIFRAWIEGVQQPWKHSAEPADHTARPHPWVSRSGRPWSLRVKSDSCAKCGRTPDAHGPDGTKVES